jgi:hypothetical protein
MNNFLAAWFTAVSLFVSNPEIETRWMKFCDSGECFTYSIASEDQRSEELFWSSMNQMEDFRKNVVAKHRRRCKIGSDLLVTVGDDTVPSGMIGIHIGRRLEMEEMFNSHELISIHSYVSDRQFRETWAHEFGHYLHSQYCVHMNSEDFALEVEAHLANGEPFDVNLLK